MRCGQIFIMAEAAKNISTPSCLCLIDSTCESNHILQLSPIHFIWSSFPPLCTYTPNVLSVIAGSLCDVSPWCVYTVWCTPLADISLLMAIKCTGFLCYLKLGLHCAFLGRLKGPLHAILRELHRALQVCHTARPQISFGETAPRLALTGCGKSQRH